MLTTVSMNGDFSVEIGFKYEFVNHSIKTHTFTIDMDQAGFLGDDTYDELTSVPSVYRTFILA